MDPLVHRLRGVLGLLGCGRTHATALAQKIAEVAVDPAQVKRTPFVILNPSVEHPTFSDAINSDRIRSESGVSIILDLPALLRQS